MLIMVSEKRVININNLTQIYIEPTNREPVYVKFGSQPVKFPTLEKAQAILAAIVDAYEQGAKVYRIPKE